MVERYAELAREVTAVPHPPSRTPHIADGPTAVVDSVSTQRCAEQQKVRKFGDQLDA